MPYVSKAQARAMHAKAERGEISKDTVKKFDQATKEKKGGFAHLPETKHMSKHAHTHPGTEAIDHEFKHSMHGKNGSHQQSHENIGGARSTINTGSPEELEKYHGSGIKHGKAGGM